MKCRLCVLIAVLLFSAHSYAQILATCSDSALVVTNQLKQLERSQLSGQVRLTNGASACALPAAPPAFTVSSQEKSIAAGQIASVDTAFHGGIVLRSSAILKLKPGIYKFKKLALEWDSKIIIDTFGLGSNRQLELQVVDGLSWMDRVQVIWPGLTDSAASARIIVAILGGNIQIGYDSKFLGTLLAPNSNIVIFDRAVLRGRILSAVQTWGWDTRGIFGGLVASPSWISSHSVSIQGARRFWTNQRSISVIWTIDGVSQDTGVVQLFRNEGQNTITRCFANICDSVIALVDWTPPVVSILSPANGYATKDSVLSLVWSADGLVTTDILSLKEGSNSFTRYASDAAGNRDSATIIVTLDRIPPQVKILSPVSGTVTNVSRVNVVWDVDKILQPADTIDLDEGINIVRRMASDSVGNYAGDSIIVMLDTKPPALTIIEPANGVTTEASKILVRWKVDTANFEEWVNLSTGVNRIEKSAVDAVGNKATAEINVIRVGEVVLPEPIAVEYSATRKSDLSFGADFLIKGQTAVQIGFLTDSTKPLERAVLRGVVVDQSRKPIVGVHVSILGRLNFGVTRTRAEGNWDLLIGGGSSRVVVFEKSGFHTSQRLVEAEGGDVVPLDTVVLVRMDSVVTEVRANASTPQIVAGSFMVDNDGSRQSVMIVPSGTNIEVENDDGSRTSLPAANLRITEYTVGELGQYAMPADLPRTTSYTFCADVTADEAPKANHLRFSNPVPFYVDNFLGFPVGWPVPVGSYDRKLGDWKELPNGRIIRILGKNEAGLAIIDLNGDGVEDDIDSLSALGFTDEERVVLGGRYVPGTSLMRAQTSSFSPIDLNYPLITDPDIKPDDDPDDDPVDASACEDGCEIDANNQSMKERIRIPGTDIDLVYNSEETDGRIAGKIVRFNLWKADSVPDNLVQVRYSINVLGRKISGTRTRAQIASEVNHEATLIWDGLDAWGRKVYGKQDAVSMLEYEYVGYYVASSRTFNSAGILTDTSVIVARSKIIRSRIKRLKLAGSPIDPLNIPGWSISSLNIIDPDQVASQSSNRSIVSPNPPSTLIKIAGGGTNRVDSGSSNSMTFSTITDIVTNLDGIIYFSTNDPLDSTRSGIWETSVIGKTSKKLALHQTAEAVGFCETAAPRQLAIGPSGTILFTTAPLGGTAFCSFNPSNGITSSIAFLPYIDNIYDITYSKYRGIVFTRGQRRLGQVSLDGVYSEIPGDGDLCYGITSNDEGDIIKHSFGKNAIEMININDETSIYAAGSAEFGGGFLGFSPGDRRGEPFSEMGYQTRSGICQTKNKDLWYSGWNVLYRISNGWLEIMAGNGRQNVRDGVPRNDVALPGAGELGGPGIAPLKDGVVFVSYNKDRYQNTGILDNPEIYYVAERKLTDSWFYSPDGESIVKYDSLWRHVKTIALDGRALRNFEYSESGYLSSITDSLGRRIIIQSDATGKAAVIISPDGRKIYLSYASNGTLERITLPNGSEWKFSTNQNGLVSQIENPQGLISTYEWDALGRLTSDRSSDGAYLEITNNRSYRASENRVVGRSGSVKTYSSTRTAEGSLIARSVDALGRTSISQTYPEGDRIDTLQNGTIITYRLIAGNPNGVEITKRSPNGYILSSERRETEYTYQDPSDFRSITSRTEYNQSTFGQTITVHDYAQKLIHTQHPDGRVDTSWLNSLGQVIAARRSGTGYRTFEYDQNGNQISESVRLNGVMQPLWKREYDDKSNRLKEWIAREPGAPMIATATHVYDVYGRRVYSINGRGERTDYGYDSRGNLNLIRDPRGAMVSKEYDVHGRVVAQWDAEEMAKPADSRRAERWQFDFDGNMIQHRDKFGIVDKNIYLESGLLAVSIKGQDSVRFEYDSVGMLIAEVNAKGESTVYEYDEKGLKTQVLRKKFGKELFFEQGDQIEEIWYDWNDFPAGMSRNGVAQWEKGYDEFGRLGYNYVSSWDWNMWQYDEFGRQEYLFTNEHVFQNVFDELGRVVARLRDEDTIEVLKLGLDGVVLERRKPGSGTDVSVYDAMGVVVRSSDSTAQSLTRILGAGGVDSITLDAKGNFKVNVVDVVGRKISGRDERGYVQHFGYDDYGELAWLEDHDGNRTRFETMRWESGEIRKTVKTMFPDGKSETVAYGSLGEVLYKVDGNGIRTENKYDRWGRLAETSYRNPQVGEASDTIRFKYDDFDRIVHAQQGANIDSTEYDQYGRVVRELHTISGSTYEVTHAFEDGNRVRVSTLPDGSLIRRSVRSDLGVDRIWYGGTIMAEFEYEQGREILRRFANNIQAVRAYDAGGRLSSLEYSRNGITLAGLGFGFDSVGNLNTIQRSHDAAGDEVMSYSEDHQLKDWKRGNLNGSAQIETPQNRQSWLLDSRGNWSEWEQAGFRETRSHSGANELLERRFGEFGVLHTWDSAGNLTADGQHEYSWSNRGYLKSVSSGMDVVAQYEYDPMGRRTVKISGGLTTVSVYDGWQCVFQNVIGSGVDTTKVFIYGNYIDEPIAMVRSWGAVSDTIWYLQGNNYNVEALIDRTGAIVERYTYTPYGEPTGYTAAGADGKWFTSDDVTGSVSAQGNTLTFQGRELDMETRNYYFRNRYYQANLGRFVSRDPIRYNAGDLSLFRFVANSPIQLNDAWGLMVNTSKTVGVVTDPGQVRVCKDNGWDATGRACMGNATSEMDYFTIRCSKGKLNISLDFDLRVYILDMDNPAWRSSITDSRYNLVNPSPRERWIATYRHELDHKRTLLAAYDLILSSAKSIDGKCCTGNDDTQSIALMWQDIWRRATAHSNQFDSDGFNQGDKYNDFPFAQ